MKRHIKAKFSTRTGKMTLQGVTMSGIPVNFSLVVTASGAAKLRDALDRYVKATVS